ncbi:hypothetical protein V6N13_095156 [Hibiscus sabdariffa]
MFLQICFVSKDCSSVQKRPPCCSTISAFTILVLLGTRVNQLLDSIIHIVSFLALSQEFLQLGAAPICPSASAQCADDLADQILEVLNFFGLGAVMCMGLTAGAYILTLFAMKYRKRVVGLILISPLCRAPSWTEWFYNKVKKFQVLKTSPTCRRPDLTGGLKRLRCRTLIFVGDSSPFHSEAIYMASKLDRRFSALVEVQACGSMVTEEQPHAMLIPMEYFFMGYGLYRPCYLSDSPRSPLSPSCISSELLSPESSGDLVSSWVLEMKQKGGLDLAGGRVGPPGVHHGCWWRAGAPGGSVWPPGVRWR